MNLQAERRWQWKEHWEFQDSAEEVPGKYQGIVDTL